MYIVQYCKCTMYIGTAAVHTSTVCTYVLVHVLGILVAVFNDVYDFAIEISSNRVFLFLYFLKQLSPEPYKTIV